MNPRQIAKCQFVPLRSIEKALSYLENEKLSNFTNCNRDLRKLQRDFITANRNNRRIKVMIHKYHLALHNAIYSHDWNKLLYLLKKSPVWEWHPIQNDEMPIYVRALVILLMNHPSAQAQDLLMEYFHMVKTCRTDVEKKALMKLIVSLPKSFLRYDFFRKKMDKKDDDCE